jgi:hypothetical protein
MDRNKQAMIEADTFDIESMMVMFSELRAREIRTAAEGGAAFVEGVGVGRCPIREVQERTDAARAGGERPANGVSSNGGRSGNGNRSPGA